MRNPGTKAWLKQQLSHKSKEELLEVCETAIDRMTETTAGHYFRKVIRDGGFNAKAKWVWGPKFRARMGTYFDKERQAHWPYWVAEVQYFGKFVGIADPTSPIDLLSATTMREARQKAKDFLAQKTGGSHD